MMKESGRTAGETTLRRASLLDALAATGEGTRLFVLSLVTLATYFLRTASLLGRRGTWSLLTWSLSVRQSEQFALRTLPLFLCLGFIVGAGIALGILHPLRDYALHTTAGPLLFSLFAFSFSPLLAILWYLLYGGPGLAVQTESLQKSGQLRALQEVQVDTFGAFAVPTALAGVTSITILSTLLTTSTAVGLWATWELFLGHPLSELLDFWVAAVSPALLWMHPIKLILLGFSLPLIPVYLGQKERRKGQTPLAQGFFTGFVLVLTFALGIEILCLALTRF